MCFRAADALRLDTPPRSPPSAGEQRLLHAPVPCTQARPHLALHPRLRPLGLARAPGWPPAAQREYRQRGDGRGGGEGEGEGEGGRERERGGGACENGQRRTETETEGEVTRGYGRPCFNVESVDDGVSSRASGHAQVIAGVSLAVWLLRTSLGYHNALTRCMWPSPEIERDHPRDARGPRGIARDHAMPPEIT